MRGSIEAHVVLVVVGLVKDSVVNIVTDFVVASVVVVVVVVVVDTAVTRASSCDRFLPQ